MIPYLDIAPVPNHDNENAIKLSPKKDMPPYLPPADEPIYTDGNGTMIATETGQKENASSIDNSFSNTAIVCGAIILLAIFIVIAGRVRKQRENIN